MFRFSIRLSVLVCFAFLASSCLSNSPVYSDFDQSQSFEGYQSFSWISGNPMTVSGEVGPSPLVAARLQTSIQQTLVSKGFRFVDDAGDADFVVAYTVGARNHSETRERQSIEFYGSHWAWGYEYFGIASPRGIARTEVTTREYAEGSLSIDIFDVTRKSPVWHGSASKRLSRKELRGQSKASTEAAVEALLSNFPPTPLSD